MWRYHLLDAILHLGVLFYRYCPLPCLRMVPLRVLSRVIALHLRNRKGRGR